MGIRPLKSTIMVRFEKLGLESQVFQTQQVFCHERKHKSKALLLALKPPSSTNPHVVPLSLKTRELLQSQSILLCVTPGELSDPVLKVCRKTKLHKQNQPQFVDWRTSALGSRKFTAHQVDPAGASVARNYKTEKGMIFSIYKSIIPSYLEKELIYRRLYIVRTF